MRIELLASVDGISLHQVDWIHFQVVLWTGLQIGEVWVKTHFTQSFVYAILCLWTGHSLKTKDGIWTLYQTNDCSTVRDIFTGLHVELYARYYLQVMDPNKHRNLILMRHFVCLYWMSALLSEMFIFCPRAGCEMWLMSYGSIHASQFLSDNKQFVLTYTHNLKTMGNKWTFCVSNDCP